MSVSKKPARHLDDIIGAGGLLPASGKPEGPVERPRWSVVMAAAYLIKSAPIELPDWSSDMGAGIESTLIDLTEAICEGVPATGLFQIESGQWERRQLTRDNFSREIIRMKTIPASGVRRPRVIVRLDGSIGIWPPNSSAEYLGPPCSEIEVDSHALRQARPRPPIVPAMPAEKEAAAEEKESSLIGLEREVYVAMKANPPREGQYAYATRLWKDHFKNKRVLKKTVQNYVSKYRAALEVEADDARET
jgi:hypothetical protein